MPQQAASNQEAQMPEPLAFPDQSEERIDAFDMQFRSRLLTDQVRVQAGFATFSAYLTEKYSLSASDSVDEAGRILRGGAPTPPPPAG